jgi:hypothetical protein
LFSRVTPFLSSAIPLLQHHLSRVKIIHEEDIALGYREVNAGAETREMRKHFPLASPATCYVVFYVKDSYLRLIKCRNKNYILYGTINFSSIFSE